MTHPYIVSTAAATRLLLKAARITPKAVTLVADIIEGRLDIDACSLEELGAEGRALVDELRRAIGRSQRARRAAQARRNSAVTPETPAPPAAAVEAPTTPAVEAPFEMRRTSRGMEKFYRWPDRSWRRTPPPTAPEPHSLKRRRRHHH